MDNSPCPPMLSPMQIKEKEGLSQASAWANIGRAKFLIARPGFILIDITELTLN